jgi:hypothetical protein
VKSPVKIAEFKYDSEVNCPHPQPFSQREKGAGLRVPLPEGEGFRVRAINLRDNSFL